MWRVSERGLARGARGKYRRRVERVLVRQKLQPAHGARVMQFLAIFGWVLLGIGYSVFLCLFFGS